MDCDLAVIGAGAAGLLAARAAELGRRVILLEKNRRAGVKILMSGGTRCNLTHDTDARGIVKAYGAQGKFLHSALASLNPRQVRDLVEAEGVLTKVEPGGKVFPVSDRATDILAAFVARLDRSGATMHLEHPVTALARADDGFLLETPRGEFHAGKVIVTTGGKSIPVPAPPGMDMRGSPNSGIRSSRRAPALTPVTVDAPWAKELSGVTIGDVGLKVLLPNADGGKAVVLAERRGSLLFTHFGLSGPVALDVSRAVSGAPNPRVLELEADFTPEIKEPALAEQLESELRASGKRQLGGLTLAGLPKRLAEQLQRLAGIDPGTKAAELSKPLRARWIQWHKRCRLAVTGVRGFEKAEVTAGGVSLDEVDSRTMESKLVPGLFLAGEILDLDGPIGGYNFQAAFSTAWLAAEHV